MIGAIVDAYTTGKDFVAESILKRKPQVVGIYRRDQGFGSFGCLYGLLQAQLLMGYPLSGNIAELGPEQVRHMNVFGFFQYSQGFLPVYGFINFLFVLRQRVFNNSQPDIAQ